MPNGSFLRLDLGALSRQLLTLGARKVGAALDASTAAAEVDSAVRHDSLDLQEAAAKVSAQVLPGKGELSKAQLAKAWTDTAIGKSGLGRLVWGDSHAARIQLQQSRAAILRAAVAFKNPARHSEMGLARLTEMHLDSVLAHLAATATAEVKGARDVPLTVIALGANARAEVGPFSSLRFAVLTDSEDSAALKVARKVFGRISAGIKGLGETNPLRPGIRPDAELSPDGRFRKVLVSTPAQLAEAARPGSDLPDSVRWELQDARTVFANHATDLGEVYRGELALRLAARAGGTPAIAEAKVLGRAAVNSPLPMDPGRWHFMDPAVLERPLHLALKSLSVQTGEANAVSALERIDALAGKGVLSADLARDVKNAATWAGKLRVEGQIELGADGNIVKLSSYDRTAARRHFDAVRRLVDKVIR